MTKSKNEMLIEAQEYIFTLEQRVAELESAILYLREEDRINVIASPNLDSKPSKSATLLTFLQAAIYPLFEKVVAKIYLSFVRRK